MTEEGYKIRNQSATHFLTFTVVEWIDIFTRQVYRDIILDSFRHCQAERGLLVHCWCIMSNHLHFIATARNNDLSEVVRDFKKFTSQELIKSVRNNPFESRKHWMLRIFAEQGSQNARNKDNQFWLQDNHPEECYSARFTFQKMNYIHENPVRAGIVANQWEYLYSSARDYREGRKCGLLRVDFL